MTEYFQDRVIVYALLDPTNAKPFYVGSTRMKLALRLEGHIAESLSDTMPETPKCRKVKALLAANLRPLIEPLEECEGEYRAARERHWHHVLKEDGAALLNSAEIVGHRRRKEKMRGSAIGDEILQWVMTAGEAEDKYKLGHGTVAKAAKEKRIPSRKSGAVTLVLRADVERLWGKR